jgi:hypothetical protein
MRVRAIRRGAEPRSGAATVTGAATPAGRPSTAALVFLRGRDADGRLRERVAERARVRPVLGALAAALLSGRSFEPLGFRCLGDWSRERLGVGARAVREWARVWRALEELPLLREAVLSGEVSWTVARLIVGVVTPENEAACLETVRGRTVRAVKALLRTVAPADESPTETSEEEDRVAVRVACSPRVATKWAAALELARRMAGEELAAWECAEAIATWLEAGEQFEDYADFDRDGFRCTVPACTARCNLQSHHIWFRSDCGPDVAWNRTTLCAYHHHRGVHARELGIRGRAPDGLIYELGVGRFASGDVKLAGRSGYTPRP